MMSKAVDTSTFDNAHWFGDAASDAVSIFNTDLYTNAQFKTDQDVYAKYLAAGKYTADSDTAAPLIREALAHLDNEPITGLTWYDGTALGSLPISKGILAEYTINRHNENPKSKDQIEFDQLKPAYTAISGWCSEFASVMADHVLGSNSTNSPFPRRASFRAFKKALSGAYYSTPSDELDDAKSSNDVPITPKVGDLLFTRGQSKNSETGKYNGHTCMVINANGSYVFTIEGNRKNPSGASGTVNNIVKRERRKIKGTNPDSGKDTIWGIGSIEWE